MLKFYDYAITFAEFPEEISLSINITGCVLNCAFCSEPWLKPDVGDELTSEKIDSLIAEHSDITVFGLMGGDNDHNDCIRVAKYIHENYPEIKVGMYSGRDFLNMDLAQHLDYYKIGRWIMPEGPVEDWHKTNCGVLQFPWSNQLLFEKIDNKLVNVTYKFRKEKINDPKRFIIYDLKVEN